MDSMGLHSTDQSPKFSFTLSGSPDSTESAFGPAPSTSDAAVAPVRYFVGRFRYRFSLLVLVEARVPDAKHASATVV